MRIERRLEQPRWLQVVVPVVSLACAFAAAAVVLAATGHDPVETYRKLFDAAFLADGALSSTLVSATPLAFTGLAAAVAFRMQLFNIGGEGQLYLGAVGAAGAAWALIPAVLRAFAATNEIITSLMLNYVAALLLNYLIFDSLSYWRDTSTPDAQVFPQGKTLPAEAAWPTFDVRGMVVPFGF